MDIDKLVELLSAGGGYGLAALFLVAILFLYRKEGTRTVHLYERMLENNEKLLERFDARLEKQTEMIEQMYYVTVGTGLHDYDFSASQEGLVREKTRNMRIGDNDG